MEQEAAILKNIPSRRKKRKNKYLLYLLIICIGIGIAILSTTLTITGTTNVKGNSWNIYFDNIQVSEGSARADIPEIDSLKTTVTYSVSLEKPGDYYEFTVDAVNDGTLDAMVDSVIKTEVNSNVLKYLDYQVTYAEGDEIALKDVLKAHDRVTYKVYIGYKSEVSEADLSEERIDLNLEFSVLYVQSDIPEKIESEFINGVKDEALSDKNIDFKYVSSDTNGKGLYIRSGTENDPYPIYYYRGEVSNNNAIFAGFCWKIVRTTETGGTKLVYYGRASNGKCSNITSSSTIVNTAKFDRAYQNMLNAGYMHGAGINDDYRTYDSNHLYGESFTYANGTYSLTSANAGKSTYRHYTCFNTTGQCSSLYYVYYGDTNVHYITLTGGKSVEDILSASENNTVNSAVKSSVDYWFSNNISTYFNNLKKDYNKYLEDTIWCSDRSIYTSGGWNPNGGSFTTNRFFSAYNRRKTGKPIFTCPRKNDSFTVTDTENGNGALTYPVGLLTLDEVIFAGGQGDRNSAFYLYNNQDWWTMTPLVISGSISTSHQYYVFSVGGVYDTPLTTDVARGVRPAISIKPSVKIAPGGNGTATAPYEFVIE